jgi:hypothetical protein
MGENKVSDQVNADQKYQVTLQSDDDRRINHYEKLKEDARNEMKQTVNQRDNYIIHLVTMLVVLCSVAFAEKGFVQVLVAGPLLTIYYTLQVLHSYRLQETLSQYLRDIVEPQLAILSKIDPRHEWGSYYLMRARPGFFRGFFLWAMWVISSGLMTFLWFNSASDYRLTLYIFAGIYMAAMLYVTRTFTWETRKRKNTRHKGSLHHSNAYLS